MHELSIAQALLDAALEVAARHDGSPVVRVRVCIGGLRQVAPDLLQFAFEAVARDTPAEGAVLEWEEVAPRVRCRRCETTFGPREIFWVCPDCGAAGGEVLAGEELILERVVLGPGPQAAEQ